MTPTVSVLIPCFNLGAYLAEAVDSVFAQTRQDFEIIVVDDGSTDRSTLELLAHFKRPRTTLFRTPNRGLAAARNHALAQARGRYICALDADDRLRPTFLEKTLSILDANPNVTFVSTWLEVFGAENWVWKQDRCDLNRLLEECVVLTAAPVRREAVLAVGGYDTSLFGGRLQGHEDWDLWLSLVEAGFQGHIIPEVLFDYRRRENSMFVAASRGEVRVRMREALIDKHGAGYARRAREVLLHREAECGEALRENARLELEIGRLTRALADARTELDSLRTKTALSTSAL